MTQHEHATPHPSTTPPASSRLPVVMIIDDSPVQTNIFRQLAKGIDAHFLILESWAQAVELFDKHAIDILITDYNLDDDYTGVDLVKHVQSRGQQPRCFFMTTESPNNIRLQLGEFNHAGFLVKPVNLKKFKLFMEKQIALLRNQGRL